MCTSFRLQANDGTIIVGRSLEFDMDLEPHLSTFQAGWVHRSMAPGKQDGHQWTAKYNAHVITAGGANLGQYFDGMNDQGLVVEGLWMPDYTIYQDEEAKAHPSQTLTNFDFILWCLTNFTTVAEVVAELRNNPVWVWGPTIPELNGIAPLHYALHDTTESKTSSLVIEYMNGVLMTYENPIGVLTNAPPFEWQQINLGNYLNLQAATTSQKVFATKELIPPGVGGGFLGIPGDWTPPSRFVRMANMCQYANPVPHAEAALNLAEHLLNTVDIPKGDIITSPSPKRVEYTQYSCIWDLTHRKGYYRTYDDLMLKSMDFNQLKMTQTSKPAGLPLTLSEHATPSLVNQ
jgi:choloylglycine hydrolase